MQPYGQLHKSFKELRARLNYVNRAWTTDNYEGLLQFYAAHVIPKIMDAERCGIFIQDPQTDRVLLKAGTGLREREIEAPMEGSVVGKAMSEGKCITENDMARYPGFHHASDAQTGFVTRSVLCAPVKSFTGGRVVGAVQALNKHGDGHFTEEDRLLMQETANYLSTAIDNILLNGEFVRLSTEINQEVSKFQTAYLKEVPFVAESPAMRKVIELVCMISSNPIDVVIQGENGTGKEVIARMIHERRDRRARPFVAVNCSAIPETLVESEFFGYEKGAFTGALSSRKGLFEAAEGGSLFLDEIADMPLSMQPKFLRAIQEGEGTRLGSHRVISYDFRIISATNKDLREAVKEHRFREDLFYRLFSVEIVVPPLRERQEDIGPLAVAFLEDVCRRFNKELAGFSNDLLSLFEAYHWPGNVRQLRHEVERLVALAPEGAILTPEHCSSEIQAFQATASHQPTEAAGGVDADREFCLPRQVAALEIRLIKKALENTRGNKVRAAQLLNITRQGLHKKLKRYGLEG